MDLNTNLPFEEALAPCSIMARERPESAQRRYHPCSSARSARHPKPPFEARGKETAKRLSGPRDDCLNRNCHLQFRCQIGNLRPPCICDPLPTRLSRKQPGTATNSQVLCCFRRRMLFENPGNLQRRTDAWLIFWCK